MIINYVIEHQLPPVIDASHATPITCVNQDSKLLNWSFWDIIHALGGSRTYPGPRPQFPDAEPGRTARYSVTVTVISLYEQWNNNSTDGISVIPREPCNGTLSRLRNLNPRSTQNTDAVSSINFSNPGVSYSITLLLNSVKTINSHVTYNTGTMRWQ